ncbi:MAG TPA: hypothetical protein VFS60_06025 [Thermoanaerobaculia bacterium]|nr:hypothetical protein [Thermoanaerobaculia bacterium]
MGGRTGGTGAWVLVDLLAARVVEARPIQGVDVPLGREDVEEAWELARKSREVAGLLGAQLQGYRVRGEREAVGTVDNEVLGLPVRGTREDDPCTRNRCLSLLFRRGMNFLENVEVIVDLTTGTVRVDRVEEAPR